MTACPVCCGECREIWREAALHAEQCGDCGYVGSHGAEPARYEDAYFERWYLARRRERLAAFEALAADPALGLAEPALDLGAGVGHWLEVLRARGLRELVAVEPSQFGRRHLEGLARDGLPGLEIHASLDALGDQAGRFATVSVLDVLSHVDDLPGTLARLVRLLRPGGRLVVKAPHHPPALFRAARWLAPLGRGRALLSARSQHHHFSEASLTAILERFGLETLRVAGVRELDVPLRLAPAAWALQRLTRRVVGWDSLLWIGTPLGDCGPS